MKGKGGGKACQRCVRWLQGGREQALGPVSRPLPRAKTPPPPKYSQWAVVPFGTISSKLTSCPALCCTPPPPIHCVYFQADGADITIEAGDGGEITLR